MRFAFPTACMAPFALVHCAATAAEGDWYGGIQAGYLFDGHGKATLIGTSASVYGGFPNIATNSGWTLSVIAGRKLGDGWRLEAEIGPVKLVADSHPVSGLNGRQDDTFELDGSVNSTVFMANALFDLDLGHRFLTPYVQAGIGLARHNASARLNVSYDSAIWDGTHLEGQLANDPPYTEGRRNALAWNIGLGVRAALSDNLHIAAEYGFTDLGDAATAANDNNDAIRYSDLSSQRVLLELSYRF